MGAGASAIATALPWPPGAAIVLSPGASLPDGLHVSQPAHCTESGLSYWQLGGKEKARLRITEDKHHVCKLAEHFTVGLICRAGIGDEAGYDSLLLGHDNKHWLALLGNNNRSVFVVDGESGNDFDLKAKVGKDSWSQLFLRSKSGGGVSLIGVDAEGLVELGSCDINLTGSQLRSSGWAANEVHVLSIAIWNRSLSWAEMSKAIITTARAQPPLQPEDCKDEPAATVVYGKVVDLMGKPVPDVQVSWQGGDCKSNQSGQFAAVVYDADETKTQVPEDGESIRSNSSTSSSISVFLECEGFAPMTAVANRGAENSMKVTLRPISARSTIEASTGGSVTDLTSGSSLVLPPNALSYPDGTRVEGPVNVSLSVIDVTTPEGLASMPGDFSAIGIDGAEVMLQSLGAAWIGATDKDGKELVVSDGCDGVTLNLKTAAKANAAKLGVLPEMWNFDEETGKWHVEPSAMQVDGKPVLNAARPQTVSALPASSSSTTEAPKSFKRKAKYAKGSYDKDSGGLVTGCMSPEDFMQAVARDGPKVISGTITKLGYINCDLAYHHPQRAVMLKGVVLSAKREAMVKVQLWSAGRDYEGRTPDVTGDDGRFGAMIAQFDSEVDIEVQYRLQSTSDEVIDVSFSARPSRKHLSKELAQMLLVVPGRYVQKNKDALTWSKEAQAHADQAAISWNLSRRRWEASVEGTLVFYLPGGDEPGLPFMDNWLPAPAFGPIHAPTFSRRLDVFTQNFGPFKTGPPGEFVDVGELVLEH